MKTPSHSNSLFVRFLVLISCLVHLMQSSPSFGARIAYQDLPVELQCSTLGQFLHSTKGEIPENAAQWEKALSSWGFYRADVAFSDSLAVTSLLDPRNVYSFRRHPPLGDDRYPGKVNDPILADRLFFAHGTNEKGKKITEFFSFNSYRGAYDVGVIDPSTKPVVQLRRITDCTGCHHTRGPVFSSYPWSNTTTSPVVFAARVRKLALKDPELKKVHEAVEKLREAGTLNLQARYDKVVRNTQVDGISLYHNTFDAYFEDRVKYTERTSDSHLIQSSVQDATDHLYFYQVFESATSDDRRDMLTGMVERLLKAIFGLRDEVLAKSKSDYLRTKFDIDLNPALRSPITLDSDRVFGTFDDRPTIQTADINNLKKLIAWSKEKNKIDQAVDYDDRRVHAIENGKISSVRKEKVDRFAMQFAGYDYDSNGNLVQPDKDSKYGHTADRPSKVAERLGMTEGDFSFLGALVHKTHDKYMDRVYKEKRGWEAYREQLREKAKRIQTAKPFRRLVNGNRVFTRDEFKRALMGAFSEVYGRDFVPPKAAEYSAAAKTGFNWCQPDARKLFQGRSRHCLACHHAQSPVILYYSDLKEWKLALEKNDKEALRWRALFRRHFLKKNPTMPPKEHPEFVHFWNGNASQELIEFLR